MRRVIVVAPPTDLARARALITPAEAGRVEVVAGGTSRIASVARGLAMLHPDEGIVLVHDAARPLTPSGLFGSVVAAVRHGHGAVVPGIAVADTIKQVDASGHVVSTPPREGLRAVQTPQGFLREVLEHAHDRARDRSADAAHTGQGATDDATLVEELGGPVLVVDGDPLAFKVTTADDLRRAEWLLAGGPSDV